MHPLTGSTTWVEFDGTSVTRKVWDGRSEIGEFKNGRGEFHAQDMLNGKSIYIRFIWSNTTSNTPRFGQSFCNGGKT
jgi:hypothetical protein